MTPTTSKQQELLKKFDEKFLRKSAFGVTIGAIDNLKESAEEQVHNFLLSALQSSYEAGQQDKLDEGLLRLISNMVESDAGFEADCSQLDSLQGREVSPREKILADLVSQIYRIVHPRFSECKHPDWEKETTDLLQSIKANNK